jgi:methylglutaconyl-CoA hydratase
MRFFTIEQSQLLPQVRFGFLEVQQVGPVLRIRLNRPDKRNAFTPVMADEIAYALAFAHYEPSVRCVVLDAAGPVFCAGADLSAFHDPTADVPNPTLPLPLLPVTLGDAFAEVLKPCIAQVEGPVLAGGFLLVAGCALVVSVPEATFGLPEVKRGIWPMQVMASLLRIMPPRKVLELCITGQSFPAEEAFRMGLVTRVVDKETIRQEVEDLAQQISQNAPLAIRIGLETFNQLAEVPASEQHGYLKAQLEKILESEDAKEGISAFREKRLPNWKGR